METTDLTATVLRNIRDDLASLEARLDAEIAAVRKDMQSFVARDELGGAMLLVGDRVDRIHAQLLENDLRATTGQQEPQATSNQIMISLGRTVRSRPASITASATSSTATSACSSAIQRARRV